MNFSENLQSLRSNRGMTQEELAEKLAVSRQAVSKWESKSGYPETEKILIICDIFDCNMDTLMKGKVSIDSTTSKKEYDTFFNMYSKGMAGAVGIILIGVTLLLQFVSFNSDKMAILGVVCLLLCILIAVPIFIYLGISFDNFKKDNSINYNFYTKDEIQIFNKRFALAIAFSVSLILIGVIILIILYGLELVVSESILPIIILLGFITISVPIMVYSGLQKSKYDMLKYNKNYKNELSKEDTLIGKISGVIMLTATFLFLALGFIWNLWQICWVVFPLGGIMCGIVGVIFSKNN